MHVGYRPPPMGSDPNTRRRLATAMLALSCAAWGLSFPVMKDADDALARAFGADAWLAAIGWLVAVRFLAAGLLLLPVVARSLTRALWRDALLLALPSVAGYVLQVGGARGVDAGTNAFLTSLYTPLTPLFAWVLLRRAPARRVLVAVPIALAGVLMLSGMLTGVDVGPAAGPVRLLGLHQGLIMLGAGCWALQILGIDRWARRHPPGAFSCALFLWVGLGGLLVGGVGAHLSALEPARLAAPLVDPTLLRALAALVVLSTVLAMVLINAFQPSLDPSRAALLYTLEPAFAAAFALLLHAERFEGWKLAGCLVLLLANVVVEAPIGTSPPAPAEGSAGAARPVGLESPD